MRPTLHLGMPSGMRDARWQALSGPMQGFDAVRIISQILSLQALHYLALAFITPPLLGLLTFNRYALDFQGGAASLSMILDWREIAGYPTLNGGRPWPWNRINAKPKQFQLDILRDSNLYTGNLEGAGMEEKFWWEYELFLHSQENKFIKVDDPEQIAWEGKRLGSGSVLDKVEKERLTLVETGKSNGAITDEKKVMIYKQTGWWTIFAKDSSRGWIIIIAWALTGAVDVYLLSILIRRPTHILDHTITLHFFHLLLTWFYTRQFPSSLFYWMVMAAHIGATVVWAEALSIRREMKAGWQSGLDDNISTANARSGREEDEEQSRLLGNGASSSHDSHHHSKSNSRTTTHVLFDDDENEDVDDKEKYRNGGHHSEEFEMKRLD